MADILMIGYPPLVVGYHRVRITNGRIGRFFWGDTVSAQYPMVWTQAANVDIPRI